MVLLALLDLSAAFDTVDHQLLLQRLSNRLGISGLALQWIKSYLEDRVQIVSIGDKISDRQFLDCGVPQGSDLGPVLFTTYTLPLGDIARYHKVRFHFYADDTQLYLAFSPGVDTITSFNMMQNCLCHLQSWMSNNCLRLNAEKTQILVFGSRHHHSDFISPHLIITDHELSAYKLCSKSGSRVRPSVQYGGANFKLV